MVCPPTPAEGDRARFPQVFLASSARLWLTVETC
jgi:hypothetical protein